MAIACVGLAVGMVEFWGVLWCVIAAFIATNLESVIGATIQEKFARLTNEVVNIINTSIDIQFIEIHITIIDMYIN